MTILYERLSNCKEDKGISFYAIEKGVQFSNGTLRKWQTSTPSAENVLCVARFLDVSVDYLLGNTDNPQSHKSCEDKPKAILDTPVEDDSLFLWSMGKKIAQLRKKQGLTSGQLAELCGIKPAYLRQIECGRGTPSLPLLMTFCRLLGTSANYLTGLLPEKPESDEMDILLEKIKYLPPDQVRMFIDLADVILSHLTKN